MHKRPEKPENLVSRERRFWDRESELHSEGLFETFTRAAYENIIELFRIRPHSLGLEYACGSGAFSGFITESRLIGLDISFNLLRSSKSVIPVQGDGEALPFKNRAFDFVLCAAALHHIPKLDRAIAEIARVIKPGGHIYIMELNTHHPQRKLVASRQSRFRKTFKSTHFSPAETLIPEDTLFRELGRRGFAVRLKTYVSPEYTNPTRVGRLQSLVSRYLAKGILKKHLESYVLIKAQKERSREA